MQIERLWGRGEELGLPRAASSRGSTASAADFDATRWPRSRSWRRAPPRSRSRSAARPASGASSNLLSGGHHLPRRLGDGQDRPDPGRPGRRRPRRARGLIDVVAENDDALIEKYLEGKEITTEELTGRSCRRDARGASSPSSAARAPAIGVDPAARLAGRGAAVAGRAAAVQGRDRPGGRRPRSRRRGRPGLGVLLQDHRRPVQRAASTSCASSRGNVPATQLRDLRARGGKERVGQLFKLEGKEHGRAGHRPRRHRRRRQAQGRRDRRRARDRAGGRPSRPSPSRRRS